MNFCKPESTLWLKGNTMWGAVFLVWMNTQSGLWTLPTFMCVCKWTRLMEPVSNIMTFIRSPLSPSQPHLMPHLVWPSPPQTPASHPHLHLINPLCHHCHISYYRQSKPWHEDVKMMNGLFRTGSHSGWRDTPPSLIFPIYFSLSCVCHVSLLSTLLAWRRFLHICSKIVVNTLFINYLDYIRKKVWNFLSRIFFNISI